VSASFPRDGASPVTSAAPQWFSASCLRLLASKCLPSGEYILVAGCAAIGQLRFQGAAGDGLPLMAGTASSLRQHTAAVEGSRQMNGCFGKL
jgi:hypothetical protein